MDAYYGHEDATEIDTSLGWSYLANPLHQASNPNAYEAGKKSAILRSRLDQISEEIQRRDNLKKDILSRLTGQEIQVTNLLYEIERMRGDIVFNNPTIAKRKLSLEQMLQTLELKKEDEDTACFRDQAQLRKEQREVLQEYWTEKRREQLLGD